MTFAMMCPTLLLMPAKKAVEGNKEEEEEKAEKAEQVVDEESGCICKLNVFAS